MITRVPQSNSRAYQPPVFAGKGEVGLAERDKPFASSPDSTWLGLPKGFRGTNHVGLIQTPRFGVAMPAELFDADIILGDHPTGVERYDLWDNDRRAIWDVATRPREGLTDDKGEPMGWLQPMDTVFVVTDKEELLYAAARTGFPSRYPHWVWGQSFNDLLQPQHHGLSKIYELVINTDPSYAYLLDTNPRYAQKVVMAHVFGHTDFFKNNHYFSESNRHMLRAMGDTKRLVERLKQDPIVMHEQVENSDPVETFINDFMSIQFLIDLAELSPPAVRPFGDPLPDVVRKPNLDLNVGPDMKELEMSELHRDSLLSPEDAATEVSRRLDTHERKVNGVPPRPTADVLGFLVEHSRKLKPWQRELLGQLREESYYFSPQMQTKLINEGWASFCHVKIMGEDELKDPHNRDEAVYMAKMMAGVEADNPTGINPYKLGVLLFESIYDKAARGIPIDMTEEELQKQYGFDELERMKRSEPDDVKGMKAVLQVRRWENDVTFLEKYLTPAVAKKAGLYIFDERRTWQDEIEKFITSRKFKDIKRRVVNMYRNGSSPTIEVVDGDFKGNGQLLLKHLHYDTDLNREDARETLRVMYKMWGQPVHLDTEFVLPVEVVEALERAIEMAKYYKNLAKQWASQGQQRQWWWGGRPWWEDYANVDIGPLEEKLEEYRDNYKIPIRYTTTDGKRVTIHRLDDDGEVDGLFNPKEFTFNPWDWLDPSNP